MIAVEVRQEEYDRLLGYPQGHELEGRALELAEWAREWYRSNGQPWVHRRQAAALDIGDDSVHIEGAKFSSERVRKMFRIAQAHSAMLVAVTAGPELEEEALRLWRDERPDEYFFLETYGSAVVEQLIADAGKDLSAWSKQNDLGLLPHYSPGYPDWDINEQARLFHLFGPEVVGKIEVLESGALRPKKSLLGVFGLTHRVDLPQAAISMPCQNCSLPACDFRRVPAAAIDYSTNKKALKRWAAERLSIEQLPDRTIHAQFRYDGTTCTNTGRPLSFLYDVSLGPREEGFPIIDERCSPAPDDIGHRAMCQYLKDSASLMDTIDGEKPLLGRTLDQVLTWQRSENSTGCYCEPASREHKWGLVLETIHNALH